MRYTIKFQIASWFFTPALLLATAGGGPLAHTGWFGEPGCDQAGCHRTDPLGPGSGRVAVEVGPYVPGQKQRVTVTVFDAGARRWGFQLAVREARNPQRQAGSLSPVPEDTFVWVRCASLTMPPCNNELEYATHTSVGTRPNNPAGFVSFRMDWTAPSTDVGEVVFTAAGLGADGDQGAAGDRSFIGRAVSLFAASNQPVLNEGGVVNAAGFARPGLISSGALVSLFGQRLAPPGFSREVARTDLIAGQQLPIELNRIGVDFLIPGGNPLPGYVLFVSDAQINVQAPELGLAAGRVEVQAVFNRGQGSNEIRGNRVPVDVFSVSPGLFTFDGRNAAAVHSAPPGGAFVSRSRPARPGDVILVYGAGFGTSQPVVRPGFLAPEAATLTAPVIVRLGGLTLSTSEILYAGVAPTFAGLYQFNLRIPDATPSGDLPLVLRVADRETQSGVVLAVER